MNFSEETLISVQQELVRDFNISKTGNEQRLLQEMADQINHLIQADFSRLLSILYRIDVSESTLKTTLQQQPDTDAGLLIARLILERQVQKQKLRATFKRQQDIPDDEKW